MKPSEVISVRKDGFYTIKYLDNGKTSISKMSSNAILTYWRNTVVINDNVTLGDFLNHVRSIGDYYLAIIEDILCANIRTFVAEGLDNPPINTNIELIVIEPRVNTWDVGEEYPSFDQWFMVSGIDKNNNILGIDQIPVNQLVNAIISINDTLEVDDVELDTDSQMYMYNMDVSSLFIAIFDEIAGHESPSDRNIHSSQVNKQPVKLELLAGGLESN